LARLSANVVDLTDLLAKSLAKRKPAKAAAETAHSIATPAKGAAPKASSRRRG